MNDIHAAKRNTKKSRYVCTNNWKSSNDMDNYTIEEDDCMGCCNANFFIRFGFYGR